MWLSSSGIARHSDTRTPHHHDAGPFRYTLGEERDCLDPCFPFCPHVNIRKQSSSGAPTTALACIGGRRDWLTTNKPMRSKDVVQNFNHCEGALPRFLPIAFVATGSRNRGRLPQDLASREHANTAPNEGAEFVCIVSGDVMRWASPVPPGGHRHSADASSTTGGSNEVPHASSTTKAFSHFGAWGAIPCKP